MADNVNDEGGDKRSALSCLFTLNFISMTLANFTCSLGMQMLAATLPVYVVSLEGSNAGAGLVSGALTFTAVFCRPWSGWLTDKGRRLPLALPGCACHVAASIRLRPGLASGHGAFDRPSSR
ncbi:MAG: hypothetical protein FWE89_00990 [Syntrophaceae bacterium]|nr:hypothetical protein [Syntrophaceae bacterium]